MREENIPSEEDFDRAREAMRDRDRGLSEVRSRLLERFRDCGLHEAFVQFSPAGQTFVAHLFFRQNHQVDEASRSGLSARIRSAVAEELEKAGRGSRDSLRISFEFDSHENVEAHFEGNYYLRLR
jgi:hypothetical protein